MKAGAITHIGKLGDQFTVEEGQACAKVCAINLINQVCLLTCIRAARFCWILCEGAP